MCSCIVRCGVQINRALTFLLFLLGVAISAYGVFILYQTGWQPTLFPLSISVWGALLFSNSLLYATCGYKSSCCNGFYACIMFLFFLINAVGVCFYFTHETEAIHYLNQTLVDVPKGLLDGNHIKATVTYTLYTIAGLSGIIFISASLALCQRSSLISKQSYTYNDEELDDTDDVSYQSLTNNSTSPRRRNSDRSSPNRSVKKSEATVAANRFREKYSDMYDKYNIQSQ